MSRLLEVVKDIAIIAVIVIGFAWTFFDEWDKATFFMSLACYAVLVRRSDDI